MWALNLILLDILNVFTSINFEHNLRSYNKVAYELTRLCSFEGLWYFVVFRIFGQVSGIVQASLCFFIMSISISSLTQQDNFPPNPHKHTSGKFGVGFKHEI